MHLNYNYFTICTLNQKKEELSIIMISHPVNLIFIPQSLEFPFTEKLKVQIAFYRHNKACKTNTKKFYKDQLESSSTEIPVIKFDQEQLPFCTTIKYDKKAKTFQSKQINIQMAYDADGSKQTLQLKFDLRDSLKYQKSFEVNRTLNTFVTSKKVSQPSIKLTYLMKVKFQQMEQNQPKLSDSYTFMQKKSKSKSRKKIQFAKNQKQPGQQQVETMKTTSSQTMKSSKDKSKKQIAFKQQSINNDESLKGSIKEEQQKPSRSTKKSKAKTLINGTQLTEKQIQSLKEEINWLKKQKTEQSSKLNSQISRLKSSLQTAQINNNNMAKQKQQSQKSKRELSSELTAKNQEIYKLKKQLRQLKQEKEQKKMQNGANISEINKKYHQVEQKLKNSLKAEQEWRQKFQQSQKKYLKILQDKGQLEYKMEKSKKQLQKLKKQSEDDRAQFQHELQSIRDEYARKKTDGSNSEQLQKLRKQLNKKEQIIRKIEKTQANKQNEYEAENAIFKKQNQQLKQLIERLKKNESKDSNFSSLDLKISTEKLKKQCQQAKRVQKNLLVEKSQLQSRNKIMGEQIIKLKQTIANMLNLIQQMGSQDLFTKVADCIM